MSRVVQVEKDALLMSLSGSAQYIEEDSWPGIGLSWNDKGRNAKLAELRGWFRPIMRSWGSIWPS